MRKDLALPILALAILVAILIVGGVFTGYRGSFGNLPEGSYVKVGGLTIPLPRGAQTYKVLASEDAWPKFVEATIDPLDVKPGDVQKMRVVLHDSADIVEVIAEIETDNGIRNVTLTRKEEGPVTRTDLLNRDYFVEDGKLMIAGPEEKLQSFLANFIPTAGAEEANLRKSVYEGQWVVQDTHTATYHTTFRAKNTAGQENSVTLSWTDPCNSPAGGDWVISSAESCMNTTNGADGGDLVVAAGGSLTITDATIAWNPGHTIQLTGGSIAISGASSFRQTYLWVKDSDGDGYPDGVAGQQAAANSPGAGWSRRGGGVTTGSASAYASGFLQTSTGGNAAVTPWINPQNFTGAPNGSYASVTLQQYQATPSQSTWLKVTNFGFNIPPQARITGIRADLKGYTSMEVGPNFATFYVNESLLWPYYDQYNHIGGAAFPPQYISGATTDVFNNFDSVVSIGSATSSPHVHPRPLTPQMVNVPDFGFWINIFNQGYSPSLTTYIDSVMLTIYYEEGIISAAPDCYDNNQNANPGQAGFYRLTRGATTTGAIVSDIGATGATYDFNCDAVVAKSPAFYDPNSCATRTYPTCSPNKTTPTGSCASSYSMPVCGPGPGYCVAAPGITTGGVVRCN